MNLDTTRTRQLECLNNLIVFLERQNKSKYRIVHEVALNEFSSLADKSLSKPIDLKFSYILYRCSEEGVNDTFKSVM